MNTSLSNFSCLRNVSQDSITEVSWIVDHPNDPDFDTRGNGYATAVIVFLIFLTGVPWNLFVICTIVRKKLYSNPTIMLLLNLAIANLLLCLLVMPFSIITGFSGEYFFGNTDAVRCHVCQTGILMIILPWVSVHTLALISVDRFIYLKRPLKYSVLVTPKRTLIALTTVWIICTVIALPPLFGFGEIVFSYTVSSYVPNFGSSTHVAPNYYYVLCLTVEAFLPITILFSLYISIICIIRKSIIAKFQRSVIINSADTTQGTQAEDKMTSIEKEKRSSQLRMVRLFGAIFTANVLTWLPMIALALTGAVVGTTHIPTVLFTFAYLTFLSETVIHPILEACLIREVREIMSGYLIECSRKIHSQSRKEVTTLTSNLRDSDCAGKSAAYTTPSKSITNEHDS